MPLSLAMRHKQETLPTNWLTQQHLAQHHSTGFVVTSTNFLRHYLNQPLRKQTSLVENLNLNKSILTARTGRAYLSRGLSIGKSNDIQRSAFSQEILKKPSSITVRSYSGKHLRETFKKGELIKSNSATTEQSNGGIEQRCRRIPAWSSTSSILKTLDKELDQLNGVVGKSKNAKPSKERGDTVASVKTNKVKTASHIPTDTQGSSSNLKQIKSAVTKVNLSIVLSQTRHYSREENDCMLSDCDAVEEDSDDAANNGSKVLNITPKPDKRKMEKSSNSSKSISSSRSSVTAQQRRSLYHASRSGTNTTLTNNNSNCGILSSGTQNPQSTNASASQNVVKRPPLVRAMSAPVRSSNSMTAASTIFLNAKRKPRRRKLNTGYDKDSCNLLSAKDDYNLDSKPATDKKVLTRSKSVAADVVTLVSLISSEGSDSEKEAPTISPNNSQTSSPNRRAPSLRKAGKSVSFQENYSATFQLPSKEYSHMLSRGSIASLAQRIKLNRPPMTATASIYHTTQQIHTEMHDPPAELTLEKATTLENLKRNENKTSLENVKDKPTKEEYDFPEYVRSLKERECWKLLMKMSTRGVTITYDTILRGMLTPTEFRELQKRREIEKAKDLKKSEENGPVQEATKASPTAIERLKETLLKN